MFRMKLRSNVPSTDGDNHILQYISPLPESTKAQLIAIFAIVLSFQVWQNESPPLALTDILSFLAAKLDVEQTIFEAYLPLLSAGQQESNSQESIAMFLAHCNLTYAQKLDVVVRILLNFVLVGTYHAACREFIRSLCRSLQICRDDYIAIENVVAKYIEVHKSDIDKAIKSSKETQGSRMMRYAKIGAVSLGAGAVIAVTGGLAAPALAGAFFLMGGSALAATVSVASVATIFGSAGAGLTGYKMMKRTRGLTEFEFENCGQKDKLSVMILVSGWMNDSEDYKRAFGVLADNLTAQERLLRFYNNNIPERIPKIPQEVKEFRNDFDSLYDELSAYFGKDPRDRASLISTLQLRSEHLTLLNNIVASSISSMHDGQVTLDALLSVEDTDTSVTSPKPIESGQYQYATLPEEKVAEDEVDVPIWDITGTIEYQTYEMYLLRWETKLQLELGSSIKTLVNNLASSAVQNVLAATVFTSLAAAIMWPALLIKVTDVIDNLWTIAIERADLAGIELANAILAGQHGSRPVTLVGYSFGSRVIFSCLREICRRVDHVEIADDDGETPSSSQPIAANANSAESPTVPLALRHYIHDVVLLGAPVNSNSKLWRHIRNIVSGRVVNGYSKNDLVLGIIYRYQRFQYSVSGVSEVNIDGIENMDLSDLVVKHTDYHMHMKDILQRINLCNP